MISISSSIIVTSTSSLVYHNQMIAKLCLYWSHYLSNLRIRREYNVVKFFYHYMIAKSRCFVSLFFSHAFHMHTWTSHNILVPGPKLPNDPPLDLDGHVLYFPAKESKELSPLLNSVRTIFASSRVGTRMCRALALIASGGSPYSSFENAFEIESNIPIDREDCDLCFGICCGNVIGDENA